MHSVWKPGRDVHYMDTPCLAGNSAHSLHWEQTSPAFLIIIKARPPSPFQAPPAKGEGKKRKPSQLVLLCLSREVKYRAEGDQSRNGLEAIPRISGCPNKHSISLCCLSTLLLTFLKSDCLMFSLVLYKNLWLANELLFSPNLSDFSVWCASKTLTAQRTRFSSNWFHLSDGNLEYYVCFQGNRGTDDLGFSQESFRGRWSPNT